MIQESRDFTSDLPQLAELRRFVRECGQKAWPGESSAVFDAIELALQEAGANIILHAYERKPGRPIHAEVRADAERIEVALTHEGCDFEPAAVPAPKFDGSRYGGFGVHLIRQIMDEVRYLHNEPRCGIVMIKRRSTVSTGGK